jgi:hypothetical protein
MRLLGSGETHTRASVQWYRVFSREETLNLGREVIGACDSRSMGEPSIWKFRGLFLVIGETWGAPNLHIGPQSLLRSRHREARPSPKSRAPGFRKRIRCFQLLLPLVGGVKLCPGGTTSVMCHPRDFPSSPINGRLIDLSVGVDVRARSESRRGRYDLRCGSRTSRS